MIDALPALPIIFGIAAGFLIGGIVKGAFGIGFPAVMMSILPVFIDPALAISLLALPIVITNIQQVTTGPEWRAVVRRFALAGAASAATILIVAQFLDDVPTRVIGLLVGAALVVFAVTGLFKISLPVSDGWRWQLGVGVGSGVIGGLTGIKVPTMIYAAALNLPRDTFVVTAGWLFFCSGSGLLVGLVAGDMLSGAALALSVTGVVMALIGFQVGERVRKGIDPARFRKMLLWLMLILGLRMVWANLV